MFPQGLRQLTVALFAVLALSVAIAGCSVERSEDASDSSSDMASGLGADSDSGAEPDATASATAPEGDSGFPVTVTRTDGEELVIEEPPERIVSLSPGATETFFAIGAGDQVASVDMFSDYPPEASELPRIDAYQPDPEEIISLEPDLVFAVFNPEGIVEILEDSGIQVLYLDAPRSLDGMMDQIRVLGELTGNNARADDLADQLEERVQAITDSVSDVDSSPRVYHELDSQLFTVGPGSFIGDLYNLLGAENIAEAAEGDYPQLSQEVILERNPDVIILPTDGNPEEATPGDVRARPGWDEINAVKNDRIHQIDGDIVSRPGPRIVDALEELAELLYPEAFASSHELLNSGVAVQDAASPV